jgi:hypothetical protein
MSVYGSPRAVADLADVAIVFVHEAVRSGKTRSVRIGGQLCVRLEDVEALAKQDQEGFRLEGGAARR